MSFLRSQKSFFASIALLISIGAFMMIATPFSDAQVQIFDVTGAAFSDMPNTSDQEVTPNNPYGGRGVGSIVMSGNGHQVVLSPNGTFSGKGYNQYIGYVDFMPTGLTGASVSSTCLADPTQSCDITGFIRFDNYTDPQSGGWDGQVKMSDASWNNGVVLGPETGGVRTMSGYAWGGGIVGWVDFTGVQVIITTTPGCTDDTASNYNNAATVDDGSCYYLGCTDPKASNHNPKATVDDGSCIIVEPPVLGCTDDTASNHNPLATVDDGSCIYSPVCPEINYPGGVGYDSNCPCKNAPGNQCNSNPDICPSTTVTNPSHSSYNQIDPETAGTQTSLPPQYTITEIPGKCGIVGCVTPGAMNYSNDPTITLELSSSCTFCPTGEKFDQTTKTCIGCIDRNNKIECPVAPSGPINPIFIET